MNNESDGEKDKDDKSKINGSGSSNKDATGKNKVTSNSPPKPRVPTEELDIEKGDKRSPSTSGPKGTEEPGSDKGPGGTGW